MPYNKSTFIPGGSTATVHLKCGNVRTAFLMLSLVIWIFTFILSCQVAAHSANPQLAAHAQEVISFFDRPGYFMIGPGVILVVIFNLVYGRIKVDWSNGLFINDEPVMVKYFEIKEMYGRVDLIYLKSAGRLWVVYPVTSQDNVRYNRNMSIEMKERAANEAQVKLLREELIASGAVEKRFWFFTKGVVLSVVVFILVVAFAFS
jgi:hypothetical protein